MFEAGAIIFLCLFLITLVISIWRISVLSRELKESHRLAVLGEQQAEAAAAQEAELQEAKRKVTELEIAQGREEARYDALTDQLDQLRRDHQQLRTTNEELARTGRELQAQLAAAKADNQQFEQQQHKQNERYETLQQQYESLQQRYASLNQEYTEITTRLGEKEQHFKEQLQLIEQNRQQLKQEFEQLANEILEKKGQKFTELSQSSITNLLNPLKTEMQGFKSRVERIHELESSQRVQLRTELQNLQALNREITEQAQELTTALKGQKKTQGNWGELILENVLEKSGLRLGDDYVRELSITTEEGRQRPDAVVYLPQNKHIIIDAKTSLMAYTQYINAEDDATRMQALKAHAEAVRDRITELADRDYYRLPGLNSPEIVIMFIPIESAYVEALKYDDTLYQRAIEQHVLVATPTTLLTSLNIVRQLWRFEDQSQHTAELANRAERFYRKLNSFLNSMQGVGNSIDKARDSFDQAMGQLVNGRGNLIKQASEFKDLGVSVQKELPQELVERAKLELGDGSPNR